MLLSALIAGLTRQRKNVFQLRRAELVLAHAHRVEELRALHAEHTLAEDIITPDHLPRT
jgi:hypothetical protein